MACNRDKEIYVSRSAATQVIAGINANTELNKVNLNDESKVKKSQKRKKASMKAYFCGDCQGWHLMTTNKRKVKPYRGGTGIVEISTRTHNKKGKKKTDRDKSIIIKQAGSFKIK